jgi:hypothetical protein
MAHFAILNENNVVATIVAADLIDGVKEVFPNHKIVISTLENPAAIGWVYDGEKFVAPTTESNTDTIK